MPPIKNWKKISDQKYEHQERELEVTLDDYSHITHDGRHSQYYITLHDEDGTKYEIGMRTSKRGGRKRMVGFMRNHPDPDIKALRESATLRNPQ
ncbi:hypothetical protein [Halorientalis regularis]|uniref:Uncharacterized protein n=1 Tax=Halorientalis regularis TaxID=660518 RepID=A0A1G7TDR3_9EURY|nr:hypothetical protein [Halorientalis regularis]SDG32779.1 hypothetical protein SAMN05216218_12438 [Halorientalis regularis]